MENKSKIINETSSSIILESEKIKGH
jgi:hypothetical protein